MGRPKHDSSLVLLIGIVCSLLVGTAVQPASGVFLDTLQLQPVLTTPSELLENGKPITLSDRLSLQVRYGSGRGEPPGECVDPLLCCSPLQWGRHRADRLGSASQKLNLLRSQALAILNPPRSCSLGRSLPWALILGRRLCRHHWWVSGGVGWGPRWDQSMRSRSCCYYLSPQIR